MNKLLTACASAAFLTGCGDRFEYTPPKFSDGRLFESCAAAALQTTAPNGGPIVTAPGKVTDGLFTIAKGAFNGVTTTSAPVPLPQVASTAKAAERITQATLDCMLPG